MSKPIEKEKYSAEQALGAMLHYLPSLYPDVRVPVRENAEYYLDQLMASNQYNQLQQQCEDVMDMLAAHQEESPHGPRLTLYKKRILGDFLKLWEAKGWKDGLNALVPPKQGLATFETPSEAGYYISIDIRSANFSVTNHYLGLDVINWEHFCHKYLPDMHRALVNSKSFRQNLFGNTNPKRIQTMTAGITDMYTQRINERSTTLHSQIVGVSHDEIVLRVADFGELNKALGVLRDIVWLEKVPVKYTAYSTQPIPGEGKGARLDTVYRVTDHRIYETEGNYHHKRLRGVRGDRYHLNFKKHVLELPLEAPDRMFLVEGHLGVWAD